MRSAGTKAHCWCIGMCCASALKPWQSPELAGERQALRAAALEALEAPQALTVSAWVAALLPAHPRVRQAPLEASRGAQGLLGVPIALSESCVVLSECVSSAIRRTRGHEGRPARPNSHFALVGLSDCMCVLLALHSHPSFHPSAAEPVEPPRVERLLCRTPQEQAQERL